MLSQMFNMQKCLQLMIGNDIHSQEYRNQMVLALTCELHEALGKTPWKPWKKQQEYDEEKYKKELIDCWAFLINLTMPTMSPKELYDRFVEKYKINIKRQNEGY